jgi:hypothetical protein
MAMRRRLLALAVCCAWLGLSLPEAGAAETETLSSPEQDVSDDLLRQALASELKGGANEWRQRLEEAVAILPGEKLTNSLLGQVLVDGKWQTVEQLQRTRANDPRLTDYRHHRQALNGKYRPELELARWCVAAKWDDLAKLHYTRLLAYPDATDNARTEACRILELKAVDGQYYTANELAAVELQSKAKQKAFETWRPKIVAWRKACGSKNQQFRQQALDGLRGVDDPQAILAIEASLYDSDEAFAAELIKLLGKFPEFEATQALARFALLTPTTPLVQAAVAELKPRPIHDYYPQLLVLMQAPLQSQFRIVEAPNGVIRYQHVVAQQGPQKNQMVVKDKFFTPAVSVFTPPTFFVDQRGQLLPVRQANANQPAGPQPGSEEGLVELASFLTALSVQYDVSRANVAITLANERVFHILETTGPQQLPRNPALWWDWWKQYQEKWTPTPTQYVYQQQSKGYLRSSPIFLQRAPNSCFVAGTPVWTETGKQVIERMRPGDRVLSRDIDSGELQFKPVIAKTLQAPSPLIKVVAGEEEIVATKSHPFWVSGKGWRMTKELVAGDVLHTLHGPAKVSSAVLLPVPKEAHNLVVEGFNTYFVGDTAALVHDNTYWQPTTTVTPGMRAAK